MLVVTEEFEGRPTKIIENAEDMYQSFGIGSDKVNKVIINTETALTTEEMSIWDNEVKPAIADRCSKGTHDIGRFTGEDMHIELTSKIPIFRPIYRRSQVEQDELEAENENLLKSDIIEESTSPYNNPVMTVKKKNGKKRIVNK